jgi:uncharacterized repeat protein (TIGR03803 family)
MSTTIKDSAAFQRPLALLIFLSALAACGGGGGGSAPPPGPPNPPPPPPPVIPQVTVTYLHTFELVPTDGGQPNGPLLQASDGNFYGTTRAGGTNICRAPVDPIPCGVIFRVTPGGVESVLYTFGASATDGYSPAGQLIQGQDGALYGLTSNGGAHGSGGTVFRITLNGGYSVLHSFGGFPTDGIVAVGGLVQASDGDFYGVTASGGANQCAQIPQAGSNCGTVFKVTPTGVATIVYSFGSSPSDGVTPTASLVQATDGNFYGTTINGGANACGGPNSCGTVFKMTPAGVMTTLHSFGMGQSPGFLPTDGIAPQSGLVQGRDGALYGTTASGGQGRCGFQYGCGTVFRITLAGELTILHAFAVDSREDGIGPTQYLIQGRDGNLYGMTGSGGAHVADLTGTVFRMTPAGVKTTLYSFGPSGSQPTNPVGGLVEGTDGAFYGVTAYSTNAGGTGTVFRLTVQ